MKILGAYVEHLNQNYDYNDIEYLNDDEMKEVTGSETYFGGSYDKGEAHCHPLNYALGIAQAALSAHAKIYENSTVSSYDLSNSHVKVNTKSGSVKASVWYLPVTAIWVILRNA